MIYLSEVTKKANEESEYPFSVPSIMDLKTLNFLSPITYLVGENGSGKSTFLESLAVAIDSHTIGAESLDRDETLSSAKLLAEKLKLSWKIRTHKGFFVRSEDVFGFTKYVSKTKHSLNKEADRFRSKFSGYGQKLALNTVLGQRKSLERRYGENLDANSHGETFLKIFQTRFVPGGLYLLDEPETPLSFRGQLSLVLMLREMIQKDAQFIIATHSPILTAMPEAKIYSFDDQKIQPVKYKEIKSFLLIKDFLNNPEVFLKNL